ncbi:MAG: hypothetical protein IJ880_12165 [Bacilli bacterium]|nr:hypothetical protein [Bacilli bacterium]
MNAETKNVRTHKCKHCDEMFTYEDIDVKWDYSGSVDAKIIVCPLCNKVNIIRYWDRNINPNTDQRYFF